MMSDPQPPNVEEILRAFATSALHALPSPAQVEALIVVRTTDGTGTEYSAIQGHWFEPGVDPSLSGIVGRTQKVRFDKVRQFFDILGKEVMRLGEERLRQAGEPKPEGD